MNETTIINNQKKLEKKIDVLFSIMTDIYDDIENIRSNMLEEKIKSKEEDIKFDIQEKDYLEYSKDRKIEKFWERYNKAD